LICMRDFIETATQSDAFRFHFEELARTATKFRSNERLS
jgi:hypothetical protein